MSSSNAISKKSMLSAPPISAFESLTLIRTRPRRRWPKSHSTRRNVPKSPVDPLECFHINNDDSQSDLSSDDLSIVTDDEMGTCDFLDLDDKFSPGDRGYLEKTCFGALCFLFFNVNSRTKLPPPHRLVVTGLWAHIILPPLLAGKSSHIPELVAQEIWDKLRSELQFIMEDDQNIVAITHETYNRYGQRNARKDDLTTMSRNFCIFLQNSFNGDQSYFIQRYASEVVISLWISLGEITSAASLLHQPTFINKEWTLQIRQDNQFEITLRHTKLIEQYLSILPLSTTKWQEALSLYQGWHNLLRHHMQIQYDQAVDTISFQIPRSGNSKSSSDGGKRRCKTPSRTEASGDPAELFVMGKCIYVLSSSLNSILTETPGQDASLTQLWRRQAEYLAEAIQALSQVRSEQGCQVQMRLLSALLNAKAWLTMSLSCNVVAETGIDSFVDIDCLCQGCIVEDLGTNECDEVKCLKVAKSLLGSSEQTKKSATLQLIFASIKAEVQNAMGRWLYINGRFEEARSYLEDAVNLRRQVLVLLKDTQPEFSSFRLWSYPVVKELNDEIESGFLQLCFEASETEQQVEEVEVALAQSLEYAGLAFHACGLSTAAMSWLEEARVLTTVHVGRMSLELARLNSSIAVVHEDLMQWETALSRHRESLRIRMHELNQKFSDDWIVTEHDLFSTILDTLTSMGNIYRMFGDHENAVACHWKIANMSQNEWECLSRTSDEVAFWGFDGHHKMTADHRTMPVPTLVLEEERLCKNRLMASPWQAPPMDPRKDLHERENTILSRSAQAYQTILRIFEDKAKITPTVCKSLSVVAEEDLPLFLVSTYRLGMIHIFWGHFSSAIRCMEHCINGFWILESSSSESSSEEENEEGNSQVCKHRKDVVRGALGNEISAIDDEAVYHALGICRSACGEYRHSIRFYLTALKCARRRHGINSIRASEILYDTATSYWYLKEYQKAEEFWSSSLRMLSQIGNQDIDRYFTARTLYNVGASLCALGRYTEPRTEESLEKARLTFEDLMRTQECVEVANSLFYLSLVQFRKGLCVNALYLDDSRASLRQATNFYRISGLFQASHDDNRERNSQTNSALQAHALHIEAKVFESLDQKHRAMELYNEAMRLYRSLEDTRWKIFVASVLNSIGKLHVRMFPHSDLAAIIKFEEALQLRKELFGCDHEAVGDTLYQLAEIHSRNGNHSIAMDMFHEALRIQMKTEGSEASAVAMSLQMIASVYFTQGNFEKALEMLEASLSIRTNRVKLVTRASSLDSFWTSDLADDFLALSAEAINQQGSGLNCKITLQDDLVQEEVRLAVVLHCIGNVWVKLGDFSQARTFLEQSLLVRRNHPATIAMSGDQSTSLHVSDTLHNLGCLYELERNYQRAAQYYATALTLKCDQSAHEVNKDLSNTKDLSNLGKSAIDERYLKCNGTLSYAMTLHRLGTIYFRLGDRNAAVDCLHSAVRIQRQLLGLYHSRVAKTLVDLACLLRSSDGKNDEALACYNEAYEIRRLRSRSDADVCHILYRIGQIYDRKADFTIATSFYYQALLTFGRRRVNALSRKICQVIPLRRRKIVDDDANTTDILAKSGFQVLSIEETDDLISSHIRTISTALRDSTQKRLQNFDGSITMNLDVHTPDCLISFELYLLNLIELFHYLSSHFSTSTKRLIAYTRCQLDQIGVEEMKMSDDITFKMLCLIQE